MIKPDRLEVNPARPFATMRDLERHTFLDVDDAETATGEVVTAIEEPEVMGFTASVIELRDRFLSRDEVPDIDLTMDEHLFIPVASSGESIGGNPFPRPQPPKTTPVEAVRGNVIRGDFGGEPRRRGYPLVPPKRLDIGSSDEALRDFLAEHSPQPTPAQSFDEEIRQLFAEAETTPTVDPGDFAITEPLFEAEETQPLATFELPTKKRGFMRRVLDKLPHLARTPEAKHRRNRRIGIGLAVASVALAVTAVGVGGKMLGNQQEVAATPSTTSAPTTTVYEAPTTAPTTIANESGKFVMPVLTADQGIAFDAMVAWGNTHPNSTEDDFKKTVEFAWQLEQLGITVS